MATVTVEKITKLVNKALDDSAFADRLFKEPDAVAKENGLSDDEKLVIKQMNQQNFETARKDAETKPSEQLSDKEMGNVVGGAGYIKFDGLTAAKMIVQRAMLGANMVGGTPERVL